MKKLETFTRVKYRLCVQGAPNNLFKAENTMNKRFFIFYNQIINIFFYEKFTIVKVYESDIQPQRYAAVWLTNALPSAVLLY